MIRSIRIMNIESIDLNLLLAFEALAIERSVSRAGARIGLSQPAMSNALARLRRIFEDPLFVSRGREMVPTARALELTNPVLEALGKLRAAIGDQGLFNPLTAALTFRISTTDYAEIVLLSRILPNIKREAPGISLSVTRLTGLFEVPAEKLFDGRLHFAVGLFPQPVLPGTGIASQLLFDDPWVCVAQARHPQIGKKLTLAKFLRIEHIRISYEQPELPGLIGEALASIGKTRRIGLTVPHLATVPALAARTGMLGIVPMRLAMEHASSLRLKIHPIPLRLPRSSVALLWHESKQHDPAHAWMRRIIARTVAQIGWGPPSRAALQRRSSSPGRWPLQSCLKRNPGEPLEHRSAIKALTIQPL